MTDHVLERSGGADGATWAKIAEMKSCRQPAEDSIQGRFSGLDEVRSEWLPAPSHEEDAMPLPPPAPRRPMHSRTVECAGFLRDDGLWDVEATLTDLKPFPYDDFERGTRLPHDPVHTISIRLTVDRDLTVVDAAAAMDDVPYLSCHDVPSRTAALIGMRLGSGWRGALRQRLPREETCTHLMELIGPAITTLYQAMSSREARAGDVKTAAPVDQAKPFFLGGCYSWREDGPNVAKFFPDYSKNR